jgi:Zn-finger nucleic acid-binding protein
MFVGSGFCAQCGARATRVETGTVATACPACRGRLEPALVGDVALLECSRCGGVWLGAVEFERVCADQETRAAVLHRGKESPPKTAEPAVRYRPCLVCRKMMNRVNFSRRSGTIVDVCLGHGTFLDSGELHAIARFIQGGGLERTREKEIADLRQEQRRLDAARSQGGWTPPGAGETELDGWNAGDLRQFLESLTGRKADP